jgi:1,4-alpha-glucan branching enzyme
MAVTQDNINADTRMGGNLINGGATFRVWAPGATAVYVVLNADDTYVPAPGDLLTKDSESGHWMGFIDGVKDGTEYRYWLVGAGGAGFKRDPYARELCYPDGTDDYANSNCVLRDAGSYQWVSGPFNTPPFNELVVYQFHVGVYFAEDANGKDMRADRVSKLFDAMDRIPYPRFPRWIVVHGFQGFDGLIFRHWVHSSSGFGWI